MDELQRHVEAIVRPVHANYRRKDEMREELLGHLMGLLEVEELRTDDEAEALAAAIRRFGDPAAIRRELQDSVPLPERIAFFQIPLPASATRIQTIRQALSLLKTFQSRHEGETDTRHALRCAAALGQTYLVVFGALAIFTVAFRVARGYGYELLPFIFTSGAAACAALVVGCFLFVLLGHGLERVIHGETSWPRLYLKVGGYGALMSAAVLASGLVFWLLASHNLQLDRTNFLWLVGSATALPIAFFSLARFGLAEFRHFGHWGKIEREDGAAE